MEVDVLFAICIYTITTITIITMTILLLRGDPGPSQPAIPDITSALKSVDHSGGSTVTVSHHRLIVFDKIIFICTVML